MKKDKLDSSKPLIPLHQPPGKKKIKAKQMLVI
jgi:hypothetical protein